MILPRNWGSKAWALPGVRVASLVAALAVAAASALPPAGLSSLGGSSRAASSPLSGTEKPPLEDACRETADWISRQLGPGGRAIERPPFVVAGLTAEAELDAWHRDFIAPSARAMAAEYFDRARPDEPVFPCLAVKPWLVQAGC